MVCPDSTGTTEKSYRSGCWFSGPHQINFSPFFTFSTLTSTPFRGLSPSSALSICGDSGHLFPVALVFLLGFCFVFKSVKQGKRRLISMISKIPLLNTVIPWYLSLIGSGRRDEYQINDEYRDKIFTSKCVQYPIRIVSKQSNEYQGMIIYFSYLFPGIC